MGFIRNLIDRFLRRKPASEKPAEHIETTETVAEESTAPVARYVPPAAAELEALELELEKRMKRNRRDEMFAVSKKFRVRKKYLRKYSESCDAIYECLCKIGMKELEAEGRYGKK